MRQFSQNLNIKFVQPVLEKISGQTNGQTAKWMEHISQVGSLCASNKSNK